ncbi:MAG: Tad domain-containing protein [Sphingomonadaceae bacterium]
MKAFLKKLAKDATGNVLVISGAGSMALVGGAGLGVDTVQWYLWKRQLQQAVDSAALAGGQAKSQGVGFQTQAQRELNRNANTTLTTVRIVNPPQEGAFTGDNGAVEVVATTSQRLPFSSLLIDVAPTLRARAVATSVSDGEHCVISLAPSGIGVSTQGNADVQLGCGVAANSDGYSAIDLDGTSYLKGSPLSAVGGVQYSTTNIQNGTAIQSYGAVQKDPIAARGLTVPNSPNTCAENNFTVNPNTTVNYTFGHPVHKIARFCNGLTVRGTLNLEPGVYIIDGGDFKVNSHAKITGEGVTFILTGNNPSSIATLDIQGGAELDLRAPTKLEDADWYNILFFQDPTADFPDNKIAGDSDLELEGVVYMPSGNISFNGSSGQHADCLLLVSYRVTFSGDSSLDNNCPADYSEFDTSARIVRVVE